jgi:hypothetical protein
LKGGGTGVIETAFSEISAFDGNGPSTALNRCGL